MRVSSNIFLEKTCIWLSKRTTTIGQILEIDSKTPDTRDTFWDQDGKAHLWFLSVLLIEATIEIFPRILGRFMRWWLSWCQRLLFVLSVFIMFPKLWSCFQYIAQECLQWKFAEVPSFVQWTKNSTRQHAAVWLVLCDKRDYRDADVMSVWKNWYTRICRRSNLSSNVPMPLHVTLTFSVMTVKHSNQKIFFIKNKVKFCDRPVLKAGLQLPGRERGKAHALAQVSWWMRLSVSFLTAQLRQILGAVAWCFKIQLHRLRIWSEWPASRHRHDIRDLNHAKSCIVKFVNKICAHELEISICSGRNYFELVPDEAPSQLSQTDHLFQLCVLLCTQFLGLSSTRRLFSINEGDSWYLFYTFSDWFQ